MFPAPNGEKKQKKELARWLRRTIVTYKIMQDWWLSEYLLYHIKVDKISGRPPSLWQNCVRLQGQNLKERCKAKVDNSSYVFWYIMVLVVMLQYTIIPRRGSLTSRIKRGGETVKIIPNWLKFLGFTENCRKKSRRIIRGTRKKSKMEFRRLLRNTGGIWLIC